MTFHVPLSVRNVRRKRSGWAFTLMELLIVLTVIGIMSGGIAVMFVRWSTDNQARTSAQDLAAAISFAARESRVHGATFRVEFPEDGTSYRVTRLAHGWANAGTPEDAFLTVPGPAGRWHKLGKEVQISHVDIGRTRLNSSPRALTFSGSDDSFSGIISLESGPSKWRLDVNPLGAVSVTEVQEDPHE